MASDYWNDSQVPPFSMASMLQVLFSTAVKVLAPAPAAAAVWVVMSLLVFSEEFRRRSYAWENLPLGSGMMLMRNSAVSFQSAMTFWALATASS